MGTPENGAGGRFWEPGTGPTGSAPTRDQFSTPNWTQTLTLTPAEQQALESQQQITQKQSSLAQLLQGQVADTMKSGFNAPQLADYMKGVGTTQQQFGGFTPYGVGATDQRQINVGRNLAGVNGTNQSFGSRAQDVNLNAPQFSDETAAAGAKAAYGASTALLKDQWAQDTKGLDAQLRLQGLQPGTEAYNTAYGNLSRSQAAQQNQLADQAVVTGNNIANQNYASQLAGFGAGNTAIGQQYGQDANTFNTSNAGQNQAWQQALGTYQAQLQGQSAYNTSQNQAYTQQLADYGANQSAQTLSNAAQQQAYEQALGQYGTAYSGAYQDYLQPLNSMNAVLGGNQVQMPNMPGFATAGYTPGADQSGATAASGSWQQGIYNRDAATASGNNTAALGSVAAIAAAFI